LDYAYTCTKQPSGGSIRLASNDPLHPPLINPGLLSDDFDLAVLREAVKSSRRYVAGPAWNNYVLGPQGAVSSAKTDAELDASIRENALAFTHPVGSAGMSAKDAAYGVVDPDLTVKGIAGLRVVDASILVRRRGYPLPSNVNRFIFVVFAATHPQRACTSSSVCRRRESCRPHQSCARLIFLWTPVALPLLDLV